MYVTLPTIHAREIFFLDAIPVTPVRKLFPDDEPPECSTCDENAWSARGKTWDELECFRGYLIPGIFGGFPEDTFELTRFIPSSWLAKLFNSFLWSFQLTRIPSISRARSSLFLATFYPTLGVETLTFCRRFSVLVRWDIHWKVSI